MLDKPDNLTVTELMAELGRKARAAAGPLAIASAERKHAALIGMAEALLRRKDLILNANVLDVAAAEAAGTAASFIDRLKLMKHAFALWPMVSARLQL